MARCFNSNRISSVVIFKVGNSHVFYCILFYNHLQVVVCVCGNLSYILLMELGMGMKALKE